MQELGDRTISELHGTHFDIPQPGRRIEARIAPVNDGGIYYASPSEDWSRPGRMWWSVPDGLDSFATWKEVTNIYHEGVPGHHLQWVQTLAEGENLNRWQRLLCWVPGHGEGWAVYAERLMEELGYLDDPGARLGMLDANLMDALIVVLDIGVHLELTIPEGASWSPGAGERWNAELAWEFLRAHSSLEEERLRPELHRYLGWPGPTPGSGPGTPSASGSSTPGRSAWAPWAWTRCARRSPACRPGILIGIAGVSRWSRSRCRGRSG
jgi:uncharacterized protein (DUF885 family)